jgi:hypothetical protein
MVDGRPANRPLPPNAQARRTSVPGRDSRSVPRAPTRGRPVPIRRGAQTSGLCRGLPPSPAGEPRTGHNVPLGVPRCLVRSRRGAPWSARRRSRPHSCLVRSLGGATPGRASGRRANGARVPGWAPTFPPGAVLLPFAMNPVSAFCPDSPPEAVGERSTEPASALPASSLPLDERSVLPTVPQRNPLAPAFPRLRGADG